MSVISSDIKIYGSVNMQETDSGLQGGAVDTSIKLSFEDLTADQNNAVQIVSSSGEDTTQGIHIYGRTNAGSLVDSSGTLNGTTAVAISQSFERVLKAIKISCNGDAAIEQTSAERDHTAQDGAASSSSGDATVTLDAGASAVDDYYNGHVFRLNGGTGSGQIRQIIDYVGTTKVATVNRDWATVPDNTSEFIVSKGLVFDSLPNEITTIRRPFYNVSADSAGGSERNYYEKCFVQNENDVKALLGATIIEHEDLTENYNANVTFDTENIIEGTGTADSRVTAPTGIGSSFDDTNKTVPGDDLQPSGACGLWLKLTLNAGAPATNTTFTIQASGTST